MAAEQSCERFLVRGTVQGVNFRAYTQQIAQQLSITGWVRNLEDGGVEAVACGSAEQLAQLEQALWQGPPAANVTAIEREKIMPTERYNAFHLYK